MSPQTERDLFYLRLAIATGDDFRPSSDPFMASSHFSPIRSHRHKTKRSETSNGLYPQWVLFLP